MITFILFLLFYMPINFPSHLIHLLSQIYKHLACISFLCIPSPGWLLLYLICATRHLPIQTLKLIYFVHLQIYIRCQIIRWSSGHGSVTLPSSNWGIMFHQRRMVQLLLFCCSTKPETIVNVFPLFPSTLLPALEWMQRNCPNNF